MGPIFQATSLALLPELGTLTRQIAKLVGVAPMILHADGSSLRTLYGDWASTTCDELGKPQSKYLDAYSRVVEVREYLGKGCVLDPTGTLGVDVLKTTIAYNTLGLRTAVTDALGNGSSVSYDLMGNKLQEVDPDRGTWIYTYDDNGNTLTSKDSRDINFRYSYDALDRVTEQKKTGGYESVVAAYVYDEADHGAGIGRLSRVSYTAGTLWYNYDITGNVIDEYRQIDLMVTGRSALGSPPIGAYHVGRTYDYLGRLATLTYPDGEVVSHGYDAAGRLYSVGSYVTAATYDARDNLTSRTLGNGVVETFAYHPNRFWLTRSTASNGSALHDVSYGRNSRGEVTSRQNALLAEDAWTYGYDDLRRLTTSTATGNSAWSQSFSYDPIGRILSQSGTGAYTYAGPGAGPLHGPATVNGAAVTYNASGQMTSGMGVTQVSYDLQGRVNYADGSNYTYDHAGELVSSTESRYMSGLFEINKSTGVSTNYISFEDARVARKRAGAIVFYHGDQVGSVSAITDGAGAVVQRNVFSPFGKLLWQAGSLADNPFGLAAQRAEPSGLYHMGARRMSPIAGMFISPDPSNAPDPLQPQTLNRFAYTRNSPINLVDPTGYADEGAANGESRWQRTYLMADPNEKRQECKSTCLDIRNGADLVRGGLQGMTKDVLLSVFAKVSVQSEQKRHASELDAVKYFGALGLAFQDKLGLEISANLIKMADTDYRVMDFNYNDDFWGSRSVSVIRYTGNGLWRAILHTHPTLDSFSGTGHYMEGGRGRTAISNDDISMSRLHSTNGYVVKDDGTVKFFNYSGWRAAGAQGKPGVPVYAGASVHEID